MESLNKFVKYLMTEGKDINDILNMPIHFVTELLKERVTVKQGNSFFDLLS